MPTSTTKELRELSKVWGKTKAAPAMGNAVFPDANYVAKLKKLTFNKSKQGTRWQVSEQWKVVEGDYKGQIIFNHVGITGKDDEATKLSMSFAKQRYEEAMGGTLPTDLTEMQEALTELVSSVEDTLWKLGLKTNDKKFQNVFVNGVSDETLDEETPEEIDTVDDDTVGEGEDVDDEEEILKKQLAAARAKKAKAKR